MAETVANTRELKRAGRWAGFFYLAFIATFALATYLKKLPVVSGDAAATAKNIASNEMLFRAGYMSELVAAIFFFMAAWCLYVLLKPVGRNTALLFLLLNAVGVAEESVNALLQFAALPLSTGADYLKVFSEPQLHALGLMFIKLQGTGNIAFTITFGLWLFPLAWLVIKSGYIPKILGVLLALDGLVLMVAFVQMCLFPAQYRLIYPLYPVMFVAEFSLSAWLLIFGARRTWSPAGKTA
jgi:hypothetical protein